MPDQYSNPQQGRQHTLLQPVGLDKAGPLFYEEMAMLWIKKKKQTIKCKDLTFISLILSQYAHNY